MLMLLLLVPLPPTVPEAIQMLLLLVPLPPTVPEAIQMLLLLVLLVLVLPTVPNAIIQSQALAMGQAAGQMHRACTR